ncbi:MAG: AmmeMemoRadiSam system radical SAM enzyme [Lachnospiraceae bacterium]|nr:AmmeMemoRadiSam system radical SAM enzyme [Lachnospiraceae bacterium]
MARCQVCFRQCEIEEGKEGFCRSRGCRDGRIVPLFYGKVSSLALDPIEKKPLARFFPGSRILSVGSFGCNLRCPFCQNHEISWSDEAYAEAADADLCTPEELAAIAGSCKDRGNIGLAYTYNEPLVSYEFVRDTAALIQKAGMKNVIVTNGTATLPVWRELAPFTDAANIDLKGFSARYYEQVLSGSLETVKDLIREAVTTCHVELTTLIVPGENDTEEEMEALCRWVSELTDGNGKRIGENIPLHISRFFPRFHMTEKNATDVGHIYHLADVARRLLKYVYTGNC